MSQPPSSPYPGSYPPPPQQPGGYQPPQQPGGYPQAPQQPGGYPGAGQPGFGAPTEPPKKKSNVGKILLIVLAVVVVLCVGGGVALYFAGKDAVNEVVDASKTRVVEPETLGGRAKSTDASLVSVVEEAKTEMKTTVPGATSIVGGVYGDPAKQDMLMVVGASALQVDPKKELDTGLSQLGGSLGVTEFRTIDAGPLGGDAKCGDGKSSGVDMGICAWSDRGSFGMFILYFKSSADLEKQFATLRAEVEKKD
ncbi:hypothetical protein [Micromonospora sp. NPDC093277]|uniref:hypothetical protein n=1 Tax=Micromonospora sp. NPDC093277 TaxID=3364291 RepID=UPI00380CC448